VENADGDPPTEEEQIKEDEMTLDSVNAKVDRLIEVVDALVESMNMDAEIEDSNIQEKVQANFDELVARLPKSMGNVPKSNGVLDNETDTYVPRGAKFMNRMKEIDNKTRK
jgi:ElaB/YqjD/DUF883 family membrane-anchored ribosome-binding protein